MVSTVVQASCHQCHRGPGRGHPSHWMTCGRQGSWTSDLLMHHRECREMCHLYSSNLPAPGLGRHPQGIVRRRDSEAPSHPSSWRKECKPSLLGSCGHAGRSVGSQCPTGLAPQSSRVPVLPLLEHGANGDVTAQCFIYSQCFSNVTG